MQGGAPPSISWFIIPLTIDISPINHIYWSYLCQLSYRPGAPPCDDLTVMDFGGTRLLQGHFKKKATATREKLRL